MSIMDELVAYASESGAQVAETPGGYSMTWNGGFYSHHLWRTDDKWLYGYSERGDERIPTMWSTHDQIVYKWAASRIALDAREARELPQIILPAAVETLGGRVGTRSADPTDGKPEFGGRTDPHVAENNFPPVPEPHRVLTSDPPALRRSTGFLPCPRRKPATRIIPGMVMPGSQRFRNFLLGRGGRAGVRRLLSGDC